MKKTFLSCLLLLVFCLALSFASCSQAQTPLTNNQMHALALKTVQARYDKAQLLELSAANPHTTPVTLDSPFKNNACWYATLSDPAKVVDHIDREYICVSNAGQIYFPYENKNFSEMLKSEQMNLQSCPNLVALSKYAIQLSNLALQDGWMIINNAQDYYRIKFNVPAASLPTTPERVVQEKTLVASFHPPRCDISNQKSSVSLWTWGVIGGSVNEWKIDFLPTLTLHSESRARRGGGGYD